jgi:hypothetical protein
MTNIEEIREPTAEQVRREYELHRDNPPRLFNELLDAAAGESGSPRPGNFSRLIELDLIPVQDPASQQLAKRCADLHDLFLASGAEDGHAAGADNGPVDGNNDNNEDAHNEARVAMMNRINNPIPLNPSDANPASTRILRIPVTLFLEFLELYHHLRNPGSTNPPAPIDNVNLALPGNAADPVQILHLLAGQLLATIEACLEKLFPAAPAHGQPQVPAQGPIMAIPDEDPAEVPAEVPARVLTAAEAEAEYIDYHEDEEDGEIV